MSSTNRQELSQVLLKCVRSLRLPTGIGDILLRKLVKKQREVSKDTNTTLQEMEQIKKKH